MLSEGKVGLSQLQDGATREVRLDKQASVVSTDGNARYAELALRNQLFFAANQAAIVPTAGLSTAGKVLTLYNPAGSGKNLIVLETIISLTTLPAISTTTATNIFWAGNLNPLQAAPATTTAETVRNGLLGAAAGVGQVFNTATLAATPVAIRPLATVDIMTAVGWVSLVCKDEVAGALIVPPGIYISIQASAATVALQTSVTWAELSV